MELATTAIITSAAKAVGVPVSLLLAICAHESGGHNVVVQYDGSSPSYGVCMVKQETAKMFGYKGPPSGKLKKSRLYHGTVLESLGTPKGLMVVEINAKYASKYLKFQLDRYEGDWCKSTSAYNAGRYTESKVVPGKPRNLKYVKKIVLHLPGDEKDMLICGARRQ